MKPLKGFDKWLEHEDDYCEIHAGYLLPCRACRAIALIDEAEMRRDEQEDLRTEAQS